MSFGEVSGYCVRKCVSVQVFVVVISEDFEGCEDKGQLMLDSWTEPCTCGMLEY